MYNISIIIIILQLLLFLLLKIWMIIYDTSIMSVLFSVQGDCRGEVSPLTAGQFASDHNTCAGRLGEGRSGTQFINS